MKPRRTVKDGYGFTLVEMMVVLLVIGVLMGLLLPALNKVKDTTLRVKQKAQFHTLEVGLEGFRADMGDYPASYGPYPALTGTYPETYYYYGAQRLAEALIGQDGFGFHPRSQFRRDGLADLNRDGAVNTDETVYHIGSDLVITGFSETSDQNLKARKGPYVELDSANALKLNMYQNASGVSLYPNESLDNYVFADQFKVYKSGVTTELIGMPVLYFKANTSNYTHTYNGLTNNVYRVDDNQGIFAGHPLDNLTFDANGHGYGWWYEKTTNPAFPGDDTATPPVYPRPYRNDSFILQSAGPDGLYGTEDDIFNFDDSEK